MDSFQRLSDKEGNFDERLARLRAASVAGILRLRRVQIPKFSLYPFIRPEVDLRDLSTLPTLVKLCENRFQTIYIIFYIIFFDKNTYLEQNVYTRAPKEKEKNS